MSQNLLNVLSQVTRRTVENMYLSQMERGIVIEDNGVKMIQLEESGVKIPFSLCDFNITLQDHTVRYKTPTENQIQEIIVINHLEVNERVAISSTQNGHRYIVHHKVVSGIDDGL